MIVQSSISDEDGAALAEYGNRKGLSVSSLIRSAVREIVEAMPAEIRTNARAKLAEARENAEAMDVTDLENAPWPGQSRE
jgi:hypothetical protein